MVSIIIPAFNEEAAIGEVVRDLKGTLAGAEIIVIDDGSSDRTAEAASAAGAHVVRHGGNRGYGAAIKTGIKHSDHDWIVLIDADCTYPVHSVGELLAATVDCDMAVGARAKGSGQQVHRWAANRFFSLMASYLAGERIPDLTSGFRALRALSFTLSSLRPRLRSLR